MNQPDDMITAAQAAVICGVEVRTIARWARTGYLPAAMQLPGERGARLFRRADVQRIAARRTGTDTAA